MTGLHGNKRTIWMAAIGLGLAALAGTAWLVLGAAARGHARPEPTDRLLIGFSIDSFVEERRARDRDVFVATASYLGADVIVQVGDESPELQHQQIAYLLDQGVDVLVIIPCDANELALSVAEARRRGVPVLAYDRPIMNAGADLYIGFNAERAGELQALAALARIGSGDVALYNGRRIDPDARAMHDGAMRVLEPRIASGDIRIVADYWPEELRNEEAYSMMDGFLGSGGAPDAVLAAGDMAAEAVIRALAVRRLAGIVLVAGADADLAACQRIAEGTQYMTVYKPIDRIAGTAAELAVYLARGERVTVHNAIWDGSFRVPFYEIEPTGVFADNLRETVVKDGFHLEEDVYRNVLAPGGQ